MAKAAPAATQRLDLWLWHARFFRSRSKASAFCSSGNLRLDGRHIEKAHQAVRVGDVLTFPQGRQIRVVRVLALAGRRGPASEAALLYEDLNPPSIEKRLPADSATVIAQRAPGSGRPTKKERRALDRLIGWLTGRRSQGGR